MKRDACFCEQGGSTSLLVEGALSPSNCKDTDKSPVKSEKSQGV